MVEKEKRAKLKDNLGEVLMELLGDQRIAEYYERIFCDFAPRVTGGGRFAVQRNAQLETEEVGIGFGPCGIENETVIQIKKDSFFIREGNRRRIFVESPPCLPREVPKEELSFTIASRGGSTFILGLIRVHHANGEISFKASVISEHLP